jgi:hypothetical protein
MAALCVFAALSHAAPQHNGIVDSSNNACPNDDTQAQQNILPHACAYNTLMQPALYDIEVDVCETEANQRNDTKARPQILDATL